MRQIVQSISAFAMGLSAGLLFESYFVPDESTLIAWVVLLLAGLVFVGLFWPEIRRWWWLRCTAYMRIASPLRITHILGLHEFLADEEGNGMWYRVMADPYDKARPPVNVGDWIIVTGKLQERMRGGYQTLVQCRVRGR